MEQPAQPDQLDPPALQVAPPAQPVQQALLERLEQQVPQVQAQPALPELLAQMVLPAPQALLGLMVPPEPLASVLQVQPVQLELAQQVPLELQERLALV